MLEGLATGNHMECCRDVLRSNAAMTSAAARNPLWYAPWAVEKKFGDVASPAKKTRLSIDAAKADRYSPQPGSACEYEPVANRSRVQADDATRAILPRISEPNKETSSSIANSARASLFASSIAREPPKNACMHERPSGLRS